MNLTFQLIDPAGEALLLVHTPVPREAYADLTRRLLAIRELAPRQVAFLTAPTQGGVVRVENVPPQPMKVLKASGMERIVVIEERSMAHEV